VHIFNQAFSMSPNTDLKALLANLQPKLNPGSFVFASLASGHDINLTEVVALVREPEGVSVVLEQAHALGLGLAPSPSFSWITLTVDSDLLTVGLTAAFAAVLGRAGISCNVVAGANHDHIFVPLDQASDAMQELGLLQERAASGGWE